MSNIEPADRIEKDVETIKTTITHLKQKDTEILEVLLKTKTMLDRQKIEDIKLAVLEGDDEDDSDIVPETWEQKAKQLELLQRAIRREFMEILNRNANEQQPQI